MAEQLSFDLPVRTTRGRDAFFVSDANALALAMVDDPQSWPQNKLLILGPKGSGKTHLVDIWCAEHAGEVWTLTCDSLPQDGARIAVDDVDKLAHDLTAQTHLFHLHNHLQSTGGQLLMTTSQPIVQAGFTLPDLASRLIATTATRIAPPDDALMQAVLLKHFMDRQLMPPPNVQRFLAQNIDRSFDAVAEVVAALDAQSMSEGRKITRGMASAVLDRFAD